MYEYEFILKYISKISYLHNKLYEYVIRNYDIILLSITRSKYYY